MASLVSTEFEPLERAFADYLSQTDLYPGLSEIACAEESGRLWLVAEHPAPEVADPSELLRELEMAFRDLVPTVGLPAADWAMAAEVAVRLVLQLQTADRPYAVHTFSWYPEDAAEVVFPPQPPAAPAGAPSPVPAPESTVAPGPGATDSLPEGLALSDRALALPAAAVQPPLPHPWVQQGRSWAQRGVRSLRYYWSYGLAALILVGSGAFAYALSRPCVVGSCDRLDQAAEFYSLAQGTLTNSPSSEDLAMAQSDIQTAIDLLRPIPSWSPHYDSAQGSLQRYQASVASLDAVLQALGLAREAANLSQAPPHPVERWVKVQLLWQQAIDRLAGIPAESPAFDFAQHKLREYRANHTAIGRRIVAEEEAEANFSTAIQTGNLARQRMETANSLAGWQLADKEWQAAIKGLSLIPQGTMAYAEAQAQLQDYQQQRQRSANRATLEEAGAHHYNQAVQAARAAAAYEAQGQWTLAVAQWRQAVGSARQIPSGTILSEEGAALLETYQPALDNAQGRLRSAVALQTLTTTLAQLCAGSATPCTVRDEPSQVQVMLASQFADPLRQAISPPAADGTFAFTAQLTPATQQLINQIISASHQIDRQVAVYDAQGGFVARYRPDLGGFVKN